MKRVNVLIPLILVALIGLPAWAQADNLYELTWLAFGNDGAANGGQYQVTANFGQLDNQPLRGGDYNLVGRLGAGNAITAIPTALPTGTTPVATPTPLTPSPSAKLYLSIVKR